MTTPIVLGQPMVDLILDEKEGDGPDDALIAVYNRHAAKKEHPSSRWLLKTARYSATISGPNRSGAYLTYCSFKGFTGRLALKPTTSLEAATSKLANVLFDLFGDS